MESPDPDEDFVPQWVREPLGEFPIYNMPSTSVQPTQLGADVLTSPVKISIAPRTDGDYGVTAKISSLNQGLPVFAAKLVLWGVPADPANDARRLTEIGFGDAPAGLPPKPFLSLPSRCEPVTVEMRVASWQDPDTWVTAREETPPLSGCGGELQSEARRWAAGQKPEHADRPPRRPRGSPG